MRRACTLQQQAEAKLQWIKTRMGQGGEPQTVQLVRQGEPTP